MAKLVKAVQAMYFVNETTQLAVDAKPFDYDNAITAGSLNGTVEHQGLMLLLAGSELPTWKQFIEVFKAHNKALPVAQRKAIPHSKAQGYSTINQALGNLATIREIENEFNFNPLMAWNEKAKTAKRATQPTISAILKLARAVKNGNKPEPTPMEVFEKGLKLAYKGALEFKDSKQAQARVNKLLAMAQADNITLETETETETDTE